MYFNNTKMYTKLVVFFYYTCPYLLQDPVIHIVYINQTEGLMISLNIDTSFN